MSAIIDALRPSCYYCGRIFTPHPVVGPDGSLTIEVGICIECYEELQRLNIPMTMSKNFGDDNQEEDEENYYPFDLRS